MELICTTCDGLGEERWPTKNMHPASDVYGWYPGPIRQDITALEIALGANACDYYKRTCPRCRGHGFVESGSQSVPNIPSKA